MTSKPRPEQLDQAGVRWAKSSFSSGSGDCVEVARIGGVLAVRDSKNPDRPPLVFTPAEFRAFVAGVRAGEFDHLS